jgi:hypothetical protein
MGYLVRGFLGDKQIDGILNIKNQMKFNLLKNYYDNN